VVAILLLLLMLIPELLPKFKKEDEDGIDQPEKDAPNL
jgi:hypothetical protein